MELGKNLSVDVFNEFVRGLAEFLVALKDSGAYDGASIDDILADVSLIEWYKAPATIKSDVFDKTEETLYYSDAEYDWINPFSKDLFEYSAKNGMLYPYVKRWIDWLNYNLSVVSGETPKYQYLYQRDPHEQIYDINGEVITTIEGYFN